MHCSAASKTHCITAFESHCVTVSKTHCNTAFKEHCSIAFKAHCSTALKVHCTTVSRKKPNKTGWSGNRMLFSNIFKSHCLWHHVQPNTLTPVETALKQRPCCFWKWHRRRRDPSLQHINKPSRWECGLITFCKLGASHMTLVLNVKVPSINNKLCCKGLQPPQGIKA